MVCAHLEKEGKWARWIKQLGKTQRVAVTFPANISDGEIKWSRVQVCYLRKWDINRHRLDQLLKEEPRELLATCQNDANGR